MSGMMDTVLNLGINEGVARGIVEATGNERFGLDLHRRFIQMFASVVLGVDSSLLHGVIRERQADSEADRLSDLSSADL